MLLGVFGSVSIAESLKGQHMSKDRPRLDGFEEANPECEMGDDKQARRSAKRPSEMTSEELAECNREKMMQDDAETKRWIKSKLGRTR